MGNPFLWAQALGIDSTLQGDDWPTRLAPVQIAKLHFHADESNRKTLLALLYKKADFGGIEFDDVIETYAWRGGSVSIGYVTQQSILANTIRNMSRETRDKQLSDSHRPACGWANLLRDIAPGESIKLADHACDCEALCTVEKVYHNGLPKRWRVEGMHSDGLKNRLHMYCRALDHSTAVPRFLLRERHTSHTRRFAIDWLGTGSD